ncbi:hypothetical protein C8F04DRAFT_1238542 [Mycena alexandri]|uniref:Ferric oxidoreductase domain-containing protein n=1 Tax=Mycena alexandri TaxID=1745969 RepID=A0AAD6SI45_9AGAR|nr:hypothetical protein C8F04DRAFT_1238542 [Mycena alexandri]
MKNNPISFLTGISFDKARWLGLLEHLHRVMARVICVMLWVHASGRVILDLSDDTTTHWHIGVLGASALTLLCLLSVRPLRSRSYELFLVLHLTLGVLALAAAYKHSSDILDMAVTSGPAFFLWGLDRFFASTRICLDQLSAFWQIPDFNTAHYHPSPATVSVLSSHFLRIAIDVPPHFGWRAGQSAYLTIYGAYGSSVTEAHPFTIANCSAGAWSGDEEIAGDGSTGAIGAAGEKNSDTGGSELNAPAHESGHLTFILRVRNGFTRRLREAVLAAPVEYDCRRGQVVQSIRGDGPVWLAARRQGFEQWFLFVVEIIVVQWCPCPRQPALQTRRLRMGNSRADQIIWIADALGAALLQRSSSSGLNAINIEIKLHITSAPEDTQVQSLDADSSVTSDLEAAAATIGTDEKVSSNPTVKRTLLELPNVNLIYGRPDIGGILGGENCGRRREERSVLATRLNFISVCGTTELADGVRQALRGGSGMAGLGMFERFVDVLRGGPSVVLHVEGFGSG